MERSRPKELDGCGVLIGEAEFVQVLQRLGALVSRDGNSRQLQVGVGMPWIDGDNTEKSFPGLLLLISTREVMIAEVVP